MRKTRLYLPKPLSPGSRVTLDTERAHYLGRVLRLKRGDPIVVFDGSGAEFEAIVASLAKKDAGVEVCDRLDPRRESPLVIRLVQGISRGERMDYAVQKATELGVTEIAPVLMDRSVVRLNPERAQKRSDHWQKIAISAAEQSGRTRVPRVFAPQSLDRYLAEPGHGRRYALLPGASIPLSEADGSTSDGMEILVGPEGGFEDAEAAAAASAGFVAVSLGPRILRSETAGVVAIAVLQARLGDV